MNFKKILRSPILLVVLAIVGISIGFSLITGTGFRSVTTQEGLELLKDGKVASVKIVDGEQRVDLTLKEADGDNGRAVQFYYVTQRGDDVLAAVDAVASDPQRHGRAAREVAAECFGAERVVGSLMERAGL